MSPAFAGVATDAQSSTYPYGGNGHTMHATHSDPGLNALHQFNAATPQSGTYHNNDPRAAFPYSDPSSRTQSVSSRGVTPYGGYQPLFSLQNHHADESMAHQYRRSHIADHSLDQSPGLNATIAQLVAEVRWASMAKCGCEFIFCDRYQ